MLNIEAALPRQRDIEEAEPWSPENIEEFISEDEIASRVGELAWSIAEDYRMMGAGPDDPVHFVGVLKGVVPFMADLMRAMPADVPVSVDFLAISSYGPQTRNAGGVRVLKDLDTPITGKHVLLVEDVVDTGLTLAYLLKLLRARQPKSLRVCTLLDRESVRLLDMRLHYVGFPIPDQFVVGYGLDYHQLYRNLPYIGVLKRPGDVPVPQF
ncbi:MAG: hypoxanthine phosphoribosyltransferase [Chloroflexia bacterium]|nr:hypoxanthine phosphoribosyltransferase [Chloroflexia bacterium]